MLSTSTYFHKSALTKLIKFSAIFRGEASFHLSLIFHKHSNYQTSPRLIATEPPSIFMNYWPLLLFVVCFSTKNSEQNTVYNTPSSSFSQQPSCKIDLRNTEYIFMIVGGLELGSPQFYPEHLLTSVTSWKSCQLDYSFFLSFLKG